MPLVKQNFEKSLAIVIEKVFLNQAGRTDEKADPKDIIKVVASELASAIAGEVDSYIRTADVTVGPDNIAVVGAAPGSPCAVSPVAPAKLT